MELCALQSGPRMEPTIKVNCDTVECECCEHKCDTGKGNGVLGGSDGSDTTVASTRTGSVEDDTPPNVFHRDGER